MPNSNEKFQAQQHLVQRDGVKYLPLKWRLAWLRSEYPEARISTRLASNQDGVAIFRATITLPNGGSAASWGARARLSNDIDRQSDYDLAYISEAENQALERALTMLGYGTEYSTDFDIPTEQESFALEVVSLPEPSRVTALPTQSAPTPITRNAKPTLAASDDREAEVPEAVIISPELEDDDTEDEDEPEEEATRPTNLRSVGGRQTTNRPPAAVTPLPTTGSLRNQPAATTPRPAPRSSVTPASPPPPTSNVVNPAVAERVRGIEDSALVLLIKQIYNEARRLYSLNEDRVDKRSIETYGLPANELNREQAEEFLEKIKNGVRRNQ